MQEDAQLKKPPDNHTVKLSDKIESTEIKSTEPIVHPYGPNVQTVKTNPHNKEEESKVFIQDKSTPIPGPLKDYKHLTNGEHIVKMQEEQSKEIDPCERGMECMQDKEVRWKHEDVIPEADGPTITPDGKWYQEKEKEKEKEKVKEKEEGEQEAKPYDPEEALRQRPSKTGQNHWT